MTRAPDALPAAAARRARTMAAALAITSTVGFGVLFYAFGVLLAPMAADLGWENVTLSAGLSTGLVVSGLVAPLVGRVIDQYGARGVMAVGSLVGGAGVLLWAAATHPAVYLAAWAVIGLGMAMSLYEPAFAAVARHAPARHRQSVLAITLLGALASTIFIPVTDALAGALGWRSALVVLALGYVVTTLPLCLLGVPRRGEVVAADPAATLEHAEGSDAAGSDASPTLASSAVMRRFVLAMVLGKTATIAVGAHLVVFLVSTGTTAATAAALAGGVGVAKVAGRLLVGLAARRVAARHLAMISFGLQAVAMALSLVAPPGPADVVMVILFGAGSGAITVIKPMYVVELFGTRGFGVTSGRASRVVRLSDAYAPVAIGALVTMTGSYTPAWALLASACALGMFVLPRPGAV